jgi:hypothetical protein
VRKILLLIFASLFFYSLFRDMTPVKTLILAAAIASAYGVSRIPEKLLAASKYPLIGLTLAACPVLVLYPWVRAYPITAAVVMFLSFHSLAVLLSTLDDKGKKIYKEAIGLIVLYGASCTNLFLARHPELIVPLSLSILAFLFIHNKVRMMSFMGGCTVLAFTLLILSGVHVFGSGVALSSVERYVLLGSAFLLLLFTFAGFVKRPGFVSVFAFFGLLYISLDLLLSMGFRIKGVLLSQPVLALFIVGPAIGFAMKGGGERS